MLIENLELFIKTCEFTSISKAANEFYLSRSTVSSIIANLEKEVGKPLLTRTPQGIVPTEAGLIVLDKAREIKATYDEMMLLLEEQNNNIKGTVSVGLLSSFSHELINAITAECAASYPNLDLQFHVARFGHTPLQLIDMLTEGKVSIAYGNCYDPKLHSSAQWTVEKLFADRYYLIVRKDHPFAARETVSLNDLHDCKIGCTTYIFENFKRNGYMQDDNCHVLGGATLQINTYPSADSCFHFIREKGGMGIAPLCTITNESFIKAIPLSDVQIELPYVLIYPKSKYITNAEKKFVEVFKEHHAKFLQKTLKMSADHI